MKRKIKLLLKKILKPLSEFECWLSSKWVSKAHKRLRFIDWWLPPQPESFDHHIDLYYQWQSTRNPLWLERGIFSSLVLHGGKVLELACGDGFNARNFYSLRSGSIIACDFDPKALETARRKNSSQNIRYVLADIRVAMPKGIFDNIIWDAAIEHFTPEEIEKLMKEIKSRLKNSGIISGYTIVEKKDDKNTFSHHEYEFKNKEDLMKFLTPHFKNVYVFETIYSSRHNLYFWASDGKLPFTLDWPYSVYATKN